MISLNIPADLRTPGTYIEFDSSKAITGLPAAPKKTLLIGQRLAAAPSPALAPVRITTAAQAVLAFGRGSMLAGMAAAYKLADALTECWAIAVDVTGTAAKATITATGAATAAGTIALLVAGRRVPVAVASGASPATVAAAIVAAIAAQPDLPVTAEANAGVATLTARHVGAAGNDLDVRHSFYQGEALPAGVALAITAFTGGTGTPDLAAVFAAIGDEGYPTLVTGFSDAASLASIETELASRWGPQRMIEGLAFGAMRGTMGALASFGAARNSPYVTLIGAKNAPNPSWEWAASYAAVVAFNGAIDPARPFQTLALPGLLAPSSADRFTRQERELLLRDGISTWTVDGGTVCIERAITTYQTNAAGLEDIAWLDVNTPLTLAYLRLAVRSRIALKYPRHKLAGDDAQFGAGQAIVTPKLLHAELVALFRELEAAGLVEDLDQFIGDLRVERDATDAGRVNALIPPNIVNQFRVFAGRVEFRL